MSSPRSNLPAPRGTAAAAAPREASTNLTWPSTKRPLTKFGAEFIEYFRAGYQFLYVPSAEEHRVEEEIAAAVEVYNVGQTKHPERKIQICTWDEAAGFDGVKACSDPKYKLAQNALEAAGVASNFESKPTILIFRDLDEFFIHAAVRRRVRSLCEGNKLAEAKARRMIVVISPLSEIHPRLRSHIAVLDFTLPDEDALSYMLSGLQEQMNTTVPGKGDCDVELRGQILRCLRGLTSTEAENCMSRCLIRHNGFVPEMLATIKDEKAAIVKKSEMLTYIPESTTANVTEIGGYGAFLSWMARRKKSYAKEARALQIDFPRGVILAGLPGSGKSMVAMAAGRLMGLPVFIFDIAAVLDKHVGSSEQRMRDVLRQVDAQQGCILLIDEADKVFGGANDAAGDSGVTRRVFGALLTWLANKTSPTFVIMTVNRTAGLPPELMRAGRFDAMFYTTMPTPAETREILEIHLRKRGVDPVALDFGEEEWTTLCDRLKNFLGAEIEEVVKDARYLSYDARASGTPTFEEFLEAQAGVVPLHQRDETAITEILKYCEGKAKPVNDVVVPAKRQRPSARSIDIQQP